MSVTLLYSLAPSVKKIEKKYNTCFCRTYISVDEISFTLF